MRQETDLTDITIIKALYYGNHLEDQELERAYYLVFSLKAGLNNRLKQLNKRCLE